MKTYLQHRFYDFIHDEIQWGICIFNIASALLYFWVNGTPDDVQSYIKLFYPFIFSATIIVAGRPVITWGFIFLALIIEQWSDYTKFNAIFIISLCLQLKRKYSVPVLILYIMDVFVVCYRHDRLVSCLSCHFAVCALIYFGVGKIIRLCTDVRLGQVLEKIKPLKLKEDEEQIVRELADGKMMKEITLYSKNTITKKLKNAMERNGCKEWHQLTSIYFLQKRYNLDMLQQESETEQS